MSDDVVRHPDDCERCARGESTADHLYLPRQGGRSLPRREDDPSGSVPPSSAGDSADNDGSSADGLDDLFDLGASVRGARIRGDSILLPPHVAPASGWGEGAYPGVHALGKPQHVTGRRRALVLRGLYGVAGQGIAWLGLYLLAGHLFGGAGASFVADVLVVVALVVAVIGGVSLFLSALPDADADEPSTGGEVKP